MDDKVFQELLKSVKQGGKILKGKKPPSRIFESPKVEVRFLREKFGLSQDKFAQLMGISLRTLQNWEQGRRKPEGPARILLLVAYSHPDALLEIAGQRFAKKKHSASHSHRKAS